MIVSEMSRSRFLDIMFQLMNDGVIREQDLLYITQFLFYNNHIKTACETKTFASLNHAVPR